jgi:hypothetical protein
MIFHIFQSNIDEEMGENVIQENVELFHYDIEHNNQYPEDY